MRTDPAPDPTSSTDPPRADSLRSHPTWASPDPDLAAREVPGQAADAALPLPPLSPGGRSGSSWRPGDAELGTSVYRTMGRSTSRAGWPPARVKSAVGVGGMPRPVGGVVTWLPEGRWADHGDDSGARIETGHDHRSGPGRAAEARRRRGARRVTATRVAARLAGWPRRTLAVALLVAAVVVALRPGQPSTDPGPRSAGVAVVVAARDLAAGAILARDDLRTAAVPAGLVPAGAARELPALVGRTVAGPVRRGEALTDVRIVGPGLTVGLGPQESSAVPVRLADAEAAALLRPGDRIDVLGTPVETVGTAGSAGTVVEVAARVRVLAVLRGSEAAEGVVLVIAAAPAVARRLAAAVARYRLTVTVRPP